METGPAGLRHEINLLKRGTAPLPPPVHGYVRRRITRARSAIKRIDAELTRKRSRLVDDAIQTRGIEPRLRHVLGHHTVALAHLREAFDCVSKARSAAWAAEPLLHAPARPRRPNLPRSPSSDRLAIQLFP